MAIIELIRGFCGNSLSDANMQRTDHRAEMSFKDAVYKVRRMYGMQAMLDQAVSSYYKVRSPVVPH